MEQPRTRLPMPRARSVSHLRSQPTSTAKPPLSRKPSIPLRSTRRPPTALLQAQAQIRDAVNDRGGPEGGGVAVEHLINGKVRSQSVLERARAVPGGARVDDPFLVRTPSQSTLAPTTDRVQPSHTLPTRVRSHQTTTTGSKNKPLPVRPALQVPPTTTAAATARPSPVSTTRANSNALVPKRIVGSSAPLTTVQRKSSNPLIKPTPNSRVISRKPSSRLRGSPVPPARPPTTTAIARGPSTSAVPASIPTATRARGPSATSTAPSIVTSNAPSPPAPTASAHASKLHYGQPPVGRQIRRVVSRGFARDTTQPLVWPDKTISRYSFIVAPALVIPETSLSLLFVAAFPFLPLPGFHDSQISAVAIDPSPDHCHRPFSLSCTPVYKSTRDRDVE